MAAMTVRDLHEKLEALLQEGKGDVEVKFAYNYGDFWKTAVAESICSISEATVKFSDYHLMDKLVDDEEEHQDTHRQVFILE